MSLWFTAGCPGTSPLTGQWEKQKDLNAARNETLPSLQPGTWVPWGDGAAQPLEEIWEQFSSRVSPAVAVLAGPVKAFNCVSALLKAV